MLPKPNHTFQLPSIHDSLPLDCRLYYPRNQNNTSCLNAAIVAHPYAPLGGSYDDPVVALVGRALLRNGYVVATFNFRGASGSSGRTSWSARPELEDYISAYGFMLNFLECAKRLLENADGLACTLILAGYSYGSMIASHLPAPTHVLRILDSSHFRRSPEQCASKIQAISEQLATILVGRIRGDKGFRNMSSTEQDGSAIRSVGSQNERRASLDDGADDTVSQLAANSTHVEISRPNQRQHQVQKNRPLSLDPDAGTIREASRSDVCSVQIAYLLISPLLGPVASLTTMFKRLKPAAPGDGAAVRDTSEFTELARHPTCAIFGDKDAFTSRQRLEGWAQEMQARSESRFTYFKLPGVGHFWREHDADMELKRCVDTWIGALENQGEERQNRA